MIFFSLFYSNWLINAFHTISAYVIWLVVNHSYFSASDSLVRHHLYITFTIVLLSIESFFRLSRIAFTFRYLYIAIEFSMPLKVIPTLQSYTILIPNELTLVDMFINEIDSDRISYSDTNVRVISSRYHHLCAAHRFGIITQFVHSLPVQHFVQHIQCIDKHMPMLSVIQSWSLIEISNCNTHKIWIVE